MGLPKINIIASYALAMFLAAIILLICFHDCSRNVNGKKTETDSIKFQVKKDKVKADSVRTIIVYRDSIRTKIITKWKEVRHDSLIPCETKLLVCDTVIKVDSTLISELKEGRRIDSAIIYNQDLVIRADSFAFCELRKDLKREKRKKRLIAVLAVIAAGLAVTK
jgi:hypothetical protein